MASRKRNEFLDIEDSEDDNKSDIGYDSEVAEESKTRASKRRRILDVGSRFSTSIDDEEDDDYNEYEDDEEDEGGDAQVNAQSHNLPEEDNGSGGIEEEHDDITTNSISKTKQKSLVKPLNKPPKKNKTGVIYLSSLPPYLKPSALKTLLLQRGFGPITKVFLTPSVASTSGNGGRRSNRRKTYSDGWVEFESKKTAKICADTLNANVIGGRKSGWYHDDIWNMKYLRGFKWADLMEQVQRERSEREARRRIEDTRARKEDKVFLSGVEKGKVIDGIRRKREEKKKPTMVDDEGDGAGVGEDALADLQVRRVFRQNEVKQKREDQDLSTIGEDARRVLGKIF